LILGVKRQCLLIEACSKGFFWGNLKMVKSDGTSDIFEAKLSQAIPIPSLEREISLDSTCYGDDAIVEITTDAQLIIVLEKDTIFSQVIASDLTKELGIEVLIITGRGYPDYSTKRLVHLLCKY
jgi:DNA topoisomerase VI subunit A